MTISKSDIISIVADQLEGGSGSSDSNIPITGATQLIRDLGFSSVEFVVIFEKIQQRLDHRISFIDLIMPDRSAYVDDLSISQIVEFVSRRPTRAAADACIDTYNSKREPITQEDVNLLDAAIRHQTYTKEEVKTSTQICFLLSAPRSGSTLLRRMLGCHPDVYAPMELHLMTYQDFAQRQHELSADAHSHLLEGTIAARQEIRGMTRAVSLAVEQMYVRDRRPVNQFFTELDPYISEKVLVDKTPTYAFSRATLERLKRTFPQAKYIHLTRSPNAVIKSMIDSDLGQLMRFLHTSGIRHTRFAEALWCLCEQNIRAALKDVTAKVIRVSYESVVSDPESTMVGLHRFLEITPSHQINPYAQPSSPLMEQVGNYAGDLKTFLRNEIDARAATEWQSFDSLQWLSEPTLRLLHDE